MKDPFEAACEEPDSPPESPAPPEEDAPVPNGDNDEATPGSQPSASVTQQVVNASTAAGGKGKEDEEEEDEENMDVELGRLPSGGDPDKLVKMQAILSQFTEGQMSRYESFRRSGFQKSNMKRLLASITGTQKISVPMTIVVSGIAKMFVGDLVETGKVISSMDDIYAKVEFYPDHFVESKASYDHLTSKRNDYSLRLRSHSCAVRREMGSASLLNLFRLA